MKKSEIQSQALKLLLDEYKRNSEGYVWITRNKAMNLRYVWDLVREHYYGIFKQPKDRFGQDKIPYPLTESSVWETAKSIDIDTKDINLRAIHSKAQDLAIAARYAIKDWMRSNDFGEQLNKWLFHWCLDGELIVKKVKENGRVKFKQLDLRNCIWDYQTPINETPFIERSVQEISEVVKNNPDWINRDKIGEDTGLAKLDGEQSEFDKTVPECEVFERWGKIPLSFITGQKKDEKEWVEGVIWATNLNGNAQIHKIIATKKKRPYEQVSFEDAPNRAVGRGVGEKLLFLQIYMNLIYNIRRNNNLVLFNQLFKYKKGKGITSENLAQIVAGGAIGLDDLTDLERIDTRNINFNESLNEEQNLVATANRVASTQEPASGEQMPSSMPATNAILQAQAVKSSSQLRQERFGLFLSRLFRNQLVPELKAIYKKGKEIRIDKDEKFEETKERKIASEMAKAAQAGQDPATVKQQLESVYQKQDTMFLELNEDIDFSEYDIEFFVTNEMFDKNTLIQNLQQILFNYSKIPQTPDTQKILRELYDVLGLDANTLLPSAAEAMPMPQQTPQAPGAPGGEMTQDDIISQQVSRINNVV